MNKFIALALNASTEIVGFPTVKQRYSKDDRKSARAHMKQCLLAAQSDVVFWKQQLNRATRSMLDDVDILLDQERDWQKRLLKERGVVEVCVPPLGCGCAV